MNEIFNGLKVIELASVLAGPAVGMFFAELGAEVIKVENKKTDGDVTRKWHISGEDTSKTAAYFHSINYNKTHLFLDLADEADQTTLREILTNADIVISNFNDKTAEKFGVDFTTLKNLFPQIIYAQLTGFKHEWSRLAYDIVLQAETGFLSMCGLSSDQKARMPVALIDILAAHQLKEGILIALLQRERTGKGSKIETTLEESAIASLANQATNYLMANKIPHPMGTQHPNIAPYGDIFKTIDNQEIVLSVGTDKQFTTLCELLNLQSLSKEDRFAKNADRVKNRAELNKLLAEAISKKNCEQFLKESKENKVPVGHVKNIQQVFEGETGKGMILESEDGSKRAQTVAFRIK